MALVFKVGEHKDMAPVPKGFPKCNNYFNPEDHPEENEIQHANQRIAPKIEPSSTTQDISEDTASDTETAHLTTEHTAVYHTNALQNTPNRTHHLAHNTSAAHNKHAPSVYEDDISKENTNVIGNSLNNVPPTSVYKVIDPISNDDEEDNVLNPILLEDIDSPHSRAGKTDSDTKETNDISNLSRWFRSTPSGSEKGSVMMKPASLALAATSIVIFIAAIAFAMYKACS